MSEDARHSGSESAGESEDGYLSDFDGDFERLGRGFPMISLPSLWSNKSTNREEVEEQDSKSLRDYGQWSRKLQMTTFIMDLQKGLSFSNALNRLQTVKALMEEAIGNAMHSGSDTTVEKEGEEPVGIVPATEPKKIPAYNDMVIPQDKDPQTLDEDLVKLTELPQEQINDESALRARIQHIRSLELEPAKKAVMIQRLMMGKHYDEKQAGEKPPESESDDETDSYPATPTNEELKPTYHSSGVFGCPHYQRNCKLECHQCRKWYTCRFCHDDEMQGQSIPNPHNFQRNKTKWVMCMRCQHVQRPQKDCENCEEELALYYCDKCKLFDSDDSKDIYHCDKCGICRLGLGLGIDFFHCDGCQACLSIELQGSHKCIERATMSSCPICGDYMFTSVKPVVYMSPCGHAIHQHCFDEYTAHSYKCPTCQVSVLNMEAQFRVLDKEIEEQPLPQPYCNWICFVSCNDCKARSTCRYHILGLRCGNCYSYNTTQLKLVKPEEEVLDEDQHSQDQLADQYSNESSAVASMNRMRQQLLEGHFQREEVSPFINVNKSGMLSNIENYMNGYFNDKPANVDRRVEEEEVQYYSHNLFNTARLFGKDKDNGNVSEIPEVVGSTSMARAPSITERLRNFINEAPPQLSLSEAFQTFLRGSHQGLSSGDEDDFSHQN